MDVGGNTENINQQKHDTSKVSAEAVDELSGWEEAEHDIPKLPAINLERDFLIAKSYLQTIGCRNENIWDHLNDILNHVLKERPKDCMRYFEELSRELRIKKFFLTNECDGIYKELNEEPKDVDDSKQLLRFYRRVECLYEAELSYDDKLANLDFVPIFRLLNEAGFGFPFNEAYNIQMAMRLLLKTYPIEKLKLWGKIQGTVRDYIVVEAELTAEAMGERFKQFMEITVESMQTEAAAEEEAESEASILSEYLQHPTMIEDVGEEGSMIEEGAKRKIDLYVSPPVPTPTPIEPADIPVEPPGHGVNRKVYLVANDPAEEWHLLPDAKPQQIVKAREIHKYLTGIISNKVDGYPKFPGTEKELLRTQIARITASTHVSPLGFYSTGGEEEAVEVEEGQLYTENIDYQPLPTKDLLDPTLEFWVHHEPYILKQGRTEFWRPSAAMEEEQLEEEVGLETPEIERGPPILTSLSGDVMKPDMTPPWNVRRASTLMDEDSAIVIRSNLWPGALTAVKERLFVNFYVGWGAKCHLSGFNPTIAYKVEPEYELGPEIMEMEDPSVELEELMWLRRHPKIIPHAQEGEHEEEEEEKEEEIT